MDYVPAAEVRVVDGDTIRLGRERIRILGIDTPETQNRARCDAERRLAALATMTLKELIEGLVTRQVWGAKTIPL
jgi:endonuclease YncB( thermonuclease family)